MRMLHAYSRCERTELLEVDMLGALLVNDSVAYMACCNCLSCLEVRDGAWRGDAYLCARCLAAASSSTAATAAVGVGGAGVVKCRACNRGCRVGVEGCRGTVAYDDLSVGSERFVDVYLCGKHAATAAWVWGAPNYHSLSTLDRGLRLHWRTLTAWNPRVNYLLTSGADDAVAEVPTNKRKRGGAAAAAAPAVTAATMDEDAAEEHAAVAHAVGERALCARSHSTGASNH
jgi:hypothetical protein